MNERVRMVRDRLDLSRASFGKNLGVSGDVINNLERGRVEVKEPMIKLICSVYSVDEKWLRTGEGGDDAMFVRASRSDEIDAFMKDIMRDDSDFRRKFVSVLANMTTDEWKLLENKVLELASEIMGAHDAEPTMEQQASEIKAKVGAAAEKEFILEKKAEEKFSVSPSDTGNAEADQMA